MTGDDEGPVAVANSVTPGEPAPRGRSAKGLAWAAAAVVLAAGAWMMFDKGDGGAGRTEQPVMPSAGQAASGPGVDTGNRDGARSGPGSEFAGPGYDPSRASPGVAAALASPGAGLDGATAGAIDALVPAIPIPTGPNDGSSRSAAAAPSALPCPRSFALIPDQDEAFDCLFDESAMRDGLVWGTDFYAPESKLCRAALHAGVIEATGGAVTVEWGGAQDLFVGTERNGVESGDERALARSARFRGAPPPRPGPGPCPTTFAMLPATVMCGHSA